MGRKPKKEAPRIIEVSPREELILLALYGKELYGLEIQKAVTESSDGQKQINAGTLYPVLHALDEKELVSSRWGDALNGGARRRYYMLTDSGIATVDSIQTFRANLISWQPKTL